MDRSANTFGTSRRQQILRTITDYYKEDGRVLAVLLFGSLSRGDWDAYSDIDLDIVMADKIEIDARAELKKLCLALKQAYGFEALVIADVEEGDVVLENLVQFSIRYHILSDTKPAILDTMSSLAGSITLDEIRAAANPAYDSPPMDRVVIVNQTIRYTLELYQAIRRQRVWMSMELLHRIRGLLMVLYAGSHGAIRPVHHFDSQAGPEHHEWLTALSPQANMEAIEMAFSRTLWLLDNHLAEFSDGLTQLTTSQSQILRRLIELQDKGNNLTG